MNGGALFVCHIWSVRWIISRPGFLELKGRFKVLLSKATKRIGFGGARVGK